MSRVYDDFREPDPDVRTLTTLKANYAQHGLQFDLRYQKGIFHVTGTGGGASGISGQIAADKADAVFIRLLAEHMKEGRPVSATPSANYAPSIFARGGQAEGVKKLEFVAAMNRLFKAGRIRIDEIGPASRKQKSLVLNSPTPPPRNEI